MIMKKKLVSIILAALMVVPFGMISVSADSADIPAEPEVTSANKYYIAYDGTGNGLSADTPMCSNTGKKDEALKNAWGEDNIEGDIGKIPTLIKAGGTVVIVRKGHVGADITLPATDTPICFTGVDGETSYISKNEDETFNTESAGQKGMFMTDAKTITFAGDVIFDKTVLLGRKATADTYSVAGTGKLVIKDTVTILAGKTGNPAPILNVEEGGYAYLHAVGFSAYTGKGTLVIDEALKSEVESLLANYEGTVVYAKAEADTTDSSATTDSTTTDSTTTAGATTTAPTDNPTTGDTTVVFAALAALSVVACISVVIAKKSKSDRA